MRILLTLIHKFFTITNVVHASALSALSPTTTTRKVRVGRLQEAEGRITPITISDEERPAGETTKDTEEQRQAIPDEELSVTTNVETTTVSEEQPPRDVGITTTTDVAADQPVDTGESDTGDGKEPETEED